MPDPAPPLPRADRAAAGRARRTQVPAADQAALPPATADRDPLAILRAQDASRVPDLVPIRYGRMSISPFTFLRGSAGVMAADLAATPASGIDTQLCGDAHLSNFGVFAGPDRRLLFDINDFDETHPGPFEWDVKRLAASIVVAADDRGFDAETGRAAVLHAVATYRATISQLAEEGPLAAWYGRIEFERLLEVSAPKNQKVIAKVGKKARSRTSLKAFEKLTEVVDGERRIVADLPLILPARLAPSAPDAERLASFYATYRGSLRDDVGTLLERFAWVDFARKVVGVGSVGTRAFIVLLQGGDGEPLFLQCKEAGRSVLEAFTSPSRYANGGQRVVEGQRLMQAASDIFLGWSRDPVTGVDFYFRQLRDMKGGVEIEELDPQRFVAYAGLCAITLARAHARGGDPATIGGYLGEDDAFDLEIAEWAAGYAERTSQDHASLVAAIEDGAIDAVLDV
jgi:uncharacterized protein (DUF2252 family)